jgi:hypothetical protein
MSHSRTSHSRKHSRPHSTLVKPGIAKPKPTHPIIHFKEMPDWRHFAIDDSKPISTENKTGGRRRRSKSQNRNRRRTRRH